MRVLSQTGDLRFVHTLLDYLSDPADEVRLEAAIAVEALLSQKIPAPTIELILEKMNRLAQDPVERVRRAALVILGHTGNRESYRYADECADRPKSPSQNNGGRCFSPGGQVGYSDYSPGP